MKQKKEFDTINLKPEEYEILKIASVSGAATYQLLIDKGIKPRRLRRLCECGILEKSDPHKVEIDNKVKNYFAYSLGPVGGEIALQNNYCKQLQGFNGYLHTEETEKQVVKLLDSGVDIAKILNEKEQKKYFKRELYEARNKGLKFAINDIAYWDSEGKLHSLEIETDYRDKLIQKHKVYAEQVLKVKYNSVKVDLPSRRRR